MAISGSSHLKDIDEKFCQCPICLQQYREPKLLPCLHRYCSDCLKKLIEKNQGANVAQCPECRDEFAIPEKGVDGFKTDFYMNNIIEYIQIQKSLEDDKEQECYSCSRKSNIIAYCFKCNGILCNQCHDIHMTSKSLKDHKQHALSLEDLKSKDMTLEKLADLKKPPRCEIHPEDLCRLCCRTCDNLPICVTCTYGIHKNHDINDVGIIAAEKKEKLRKDLENIDQYRERILKLPEIVERVKEKFVFNVREQKENNAKRYDNNMETVKNEIKKIRDNYSISRSEIEEEEKAKLMETNKQMDEEIKQLKIKYDNICEEIKEENKIKLANLKQKQDEGIEKNTEKLAILERDFQTTQKSLETRQEDGLAILQEISQQIDDVTEKYKNIKTTGNSVLETRNDWTAVQCIPDICKAIEPLSEDMKREFPELDTLSRMWVNPAIMEDEESPVNIECVQANGLRITGITVCDDGSSIFITGCISKARQSHVSVINIKGKVLQKKVIPQICVTPNRYCAYLSKFKIATVCKNEMGIFDIRDASYTKKNISDVTSSWPEGRCVTCVATDPINNQILIGGIGSKDVYVFDDQLNYHHTLTLPEMIKCPRDIVVSDGNLLACDFQDTGAYIVSMERQVGKIIHEFKKPGFDGDDWKPVSLCKDSDGFIYILWKTGVYVNEGRRVVTQYTEEGCQLLKTFQIDCNDLRCITTVNTGQTEKLCVASYESGKLYTYTLR